MADNAKPSTRAEYASWEPRVLVVDDDELSRVAAEGLLESLGLKVDLAHDGQQALRMAARWPYAAIFMDCMMPEVDGYTAAREISHREGTHRHTPVIAMTSRPRSVSIASGMDAHEAKPLRLDTLRRDLTGLALLPRDSAAPTSSIEIGVPGSPLLMSPAKEIAEPDCLQGTRLTAAFIEEATLLLPELWRAANAGDGPGLYRIAKDFRRRAAPLGAVRVADLSDRICRAITSGSIPTATATEPLLRQAVSDTRRAIAAYFENGASKVAHAIDGLASNAAEASAEIDQPDPPSGIRVAIADDDPLARLAIEAMIEQADGLSLVGSADGVEEIVDLAAVRRPDVVVLDWMMPSGGGPAAARRIRERHPATVIVGLTASNSREAYAEMISAGASGFLVKDATGSQVAHTIQEAVDATGGGAADRANWLDQRG